MGIIRGFNGIRLDAIRWTKGYWMRCEAMGLIKGYGMRLDALG